MHRKIDHPLTFRLYNWGPMPLIINLSKIIIVRGLIIIHIHKTVNQEVLENFSSKTLLRRFQKQAKFPNERSKIFFY